MKKTKIVVLGLNHGYKFTQDLRELEEVELTIKKQMMRKK